MVAVAYPELPTTGMTKVFTTAVFSQFLALHPRYINGLANKKTPDCQQTSAYEVGGIDSKS
jgi:hypothetical protein